MPLMVKQFLDLFKKPLQSETPQSWIGEAIKPENLATR